MKPAFIKIKIAAAPIFILSIALFCRLSQAQDEQKVTMTGYSSYSFGQIVAGTTSPDIPGSDIDHYWSHEVYTGVGFRALLNERFHLNASIEGKMWQPFPGTDPLGAAYQMKIKSYSLWLDQGNAEYGIGDPENPWCSITMGYFKYKYNPEARNLGEQLFRSLAYPGNIINYFDFPATRMLGFRGHFNFLDSSLKADALLIAETDWFPFDDISPSLIVSYSPIKAIEIGGGVELARFISMNSNLTTPKPNSVSFPANFVIDSVVRDSNGYVAKDSNGTPLPPIVMADSSCYTFKSTKLMARITIDPKAFFGESSFFGPEDGKIYGEVDVLGLKNYPYYYEDVSKRMPIMFGFNIPTFKLMDVVTLEFEHYGYPFKAFFSQQMNKTLPLPDNDYSTWDPSSTQYGFDDWKWSLYLKKTIFPGFSITTQFARDHLAYMYTTGFPYWEEAVERPGQWWWTAKLCYSL